MFRTCDQANIDLLYGFRGNLKHMNSKPRVPDLERRVVRFRVPLGSTTTCVHPEPLPGGRKARYPKLQRDFAKTDLVLIDDFGLVALNDDARRDLLQILDDRHGRKSTLVTSQLPVDTWHDHIGEPRAPDVAEARVGDGRRAPAGEHRLGPERLGRAFAESGEKPGQKRSLDQRAFAAHHRPAYPGLAGARHEPGHGGFDDRAGPFARTRHRLKPHVDLLRRQVPIGRPGDRAALYIRRLRPPVDRRPVGRTGQSQEHRARIALGLHAGGGVRACQHHDRRQFTCT